MNQSVAEFPPISILVMSHNQEEFIADCVESVLAQSYGHPLEIIFCDDCSTDRTYDIILQKTAEYCGPHKIITHRCPINGKVAVNMNTAISLSHGDWLMRVDGDDILHPDRTRLTALAINKYPGTIAVSGQYSVFSNRLKEITNPPDEDLAYLTADRYDFAAGKGVKGLAWWGGLMTMHRRIFLEFGDLPADCGIMDDTFFGTRSLMIGRFVIIKNAVFLYYRRHGNNISSSCGNDAPTLLSLMKSDAQTRSYYRRSLHCHGPILEEIRRYTATHPECQGLLDYFQKFLDDRERQGTFWQRSWASRISDAHITGPWWRKIPWALRASCPLAWALAKKLGL